jgi:hypothetical protein
LIRTREGDHQQQQQQQQQQETQSPTHTLKKNTRSSFMGHYPPPNAIPSPKEERQQVSIPISLEISKNILSNRGATPLTMYLHPLKRNHQAIMRC